MYHKIIIVGHLGRDPVFNYTPAGSPVCNFSVAANRGRKDDNTPVWFRVTCWGSLAEACNQYLAKGRPILVEGELRPDDETGGPRTWTRNDGTVGTSYEVTGRIVKFLGGHSEEDEPAEAEPIESELPF